MNPLLDPAARLVIGHRGAAAEAPENTLPSIEAAVSCGVDAVELDVHLSADGVPIVIHDAMLDRTTNRRGAVASLTLAHIREAKIGIGTGATAARVPTLAEVLHAFPGLPLLIELKTPAAQGPVASVLRAHHAARRCVLAAFDLASLRVFTAPDWARGASRAEVRSAWVRACAGRSLGTPPYQLLSVPLTYRGLPVATRRLFESARRAGIPVHVWTVNDPELAATLWRRGACGIITDDPRRLTAADGRGGPDAAA